MNHSADNSTSKCAILSVTRSNVMEKKISVLVVDDNPLIRKIHSALLKKIDLEAHVAENGKEAVELCNSGGHFDLILMDMEMPGMDGLEATTELRAMGVSCKIVGLTSRDKDSEKQAFVAVGLDDCLEKPLNASKVQYVLQGLLDMKEKA